LQKNDTTNNNNKKSKSSYRILIVDDDTDITLTFKTGLEDKGFEVDVFNDPLEVLSKFREKKNGGGCDSGIFSSMYDLLLLDVRMPKMNGFELYREIKKIDDKVKVCFITAYEVFYETLKQDFPAVDVGCFIKKPLTIEQLVKKIREELKIA
jgi:two-component system, OmpR family, response regulator ChvI